MKNNYAPVYEGIFHSFNLILVSIIIFIFFFKNILYSFIAFRNRNFHDTFSGIFRFLAIENINVPVFLFLICSITCCVFLFIHSIVILGLSFIIFLLAPAISGNIGFSATGISPSASAGKFGKLTEVLVKFAGPLNDGAPLIIFSTFLVFIFILSYIINLNQTLSSVAVMIMESNPGRSINKKVILFIIGIIFISFMSLVYFLSLF